MSKLVSEGFHPGVRSPFKGVGTEMLQQISPHIKLFSFRKRQLIFREGFKPEGLYIVKKGRVKISKNSSNGKEIILYIANESEVLGYVPLLCNADYVSSAECIEDTEAFFMPRKVFFDLIEGNSALLIRLTQHFMKEFESTLNKLIDISTKQVRRRVAEMLMHLMKAQGTEEDNQTLSISLSRDDLAHLVATNTETLVRVLSEFKKEKIIALKGKKIQVTNPVLLAKVIAIS